MTSITTHFTQDAAIFYKLLAACGYDSCEAFLNSLDAWNTDENVAKYFLVLESSKKMFSQLRSPQKMACSNVIKNMLAQKDSRVFQLAVRDVIFLCFHVYRGVRTCSEAFWKRHVWMCDGHEHRASALIRSVLIAISLGGSDIASSE